MAKVKRGLTMCITIQSGRRKKKLCKRIDKKTLEMLIALDRKMDRMIDDLVT